MEKENQSNQDELIEMLLYVAVGLISIGLICSYGFNRYIAQNNPFILDKWTKKKRLLLLVDAIIFSILYGLASFFIFEKLSFTLIIVSQIPLFLLSFSVLFYFCEEVFEKHIDFRIKHKHLKNTPGLKDFARLEASLLATKGVPIGVSKLSSEPVYLPKKERNKHLMVTGTHGSGKTSLAFTIARYDSMSGQPVIFLDPKAEKSDIDLAKKYVSMAGNGDKFRLISMSRPQESCGYNILRVGDAVAKAEKTIFAFELVHAHYGPVASSLLTTLFEILDLLNIEPSLNILEDITFSKAKMVDLFERLQEIEESEIVNKLILKIGKIEKMKDEDISGLRAALGKINSSNIGKFINPSENRPELILKDVVENGLFAYFDLNPNEHSDQFRQISKFIIKDIEILSARMQKGEVTLNSSYLSVFIDEFDTFVDERFHKFLKVARSANISLTMLFQSISGIDAIGPHLKQQLAINTFASVHFSTSSPDDLDYICKLPGTVKVSEQSKQINKKSLLQATGMGTEFQSEVFKIDPNIIREMKTDEFFLYDKTKEEHQRLNLVSSFSAKRYEHQSKTIEELMLINRPSNVVKKPNEVTIDEKTQEYMVATPNSRQSHLSFNELEKFNHLFKKIRSIYNKEGVWNPWKYI